MKFSANLSLMFNDIPSLLERYVAIVKCKHRFEAIECQAPYQHSIEQWQNTFESCRKLNKDRALPKWDLINTPPVFDLFKHVPDLEQYDRLVLKPTIEYANAFKVSKVHLMMTDAIQKDDLLKIKQLLKHAANQLQTHNITCVVEPLSVRPKYYLRCYRQAIDLIQELQQPNLKIMLDSFHLQRLNGNITELVQQMQPFVGHVQVSQVPGRDSPNNQGEINFDYFFCLARQLPTDFIGLEYKHVSNESLDWIIKYESL